MKLILIRHGESLSNLDKGVLSYTPDYLVALSKNGENQALETAEKIRESVDTYHTDFYCSPFLRAQQTAKIILNELKVETPPKEDIRLREVDIGNFIYGAAHKEMMSERLRHSRFFYRFPCGESCADVFVRVKQFLSEIKDKNQQIVIFTHAATMRVFQMIVENLTAEEFDNLPKPKNCEIMELNYFSSDR